MYTVSETFEWLHRQNVQSQGNVYCYYNNVLLTPSLESPDDFATNVLLIIDWSMDIYDFCSDWSISSMDTAVVSWSLFEGFHKQKDKLV